MGSVIAEPCYMYVVRSEHVPPGYRDSVPVRVLYPGVRRCEDSTHHFVNGTGSHPLIWLSLLLEGGYPLFSQIVKGRRVEGSELFSEENHLRQLHLVPLSLSFEINVSSPGRLPYTPGSLDDCFVPHWSLPGKVLL